MVEKCDCPIDTVAQILGKKWVIVLLRDLFVGRSQFKEFLDANKSLSNKVLTQKLKEMQEDGLIKRVVIEDPLGVRYALTQDGEALRPVIREMVKYGKSYCKSEKMYEELMVKL